MITRVTTAIAIVSLIGSLWFLWESRSPETVVMELPKSECIAICVRQRQSGTIFPDYHQNVQHCGQLFADHEYCQISVRKGR